MTTERRGGRRPGRRWTAGAVVGRGCRWLAGSGPWVAYCEGGCASVETLMGDLANNSAGTSDASPT